MTEKFEKFMEPRIPLKEAMALAGVSSEAEFGELIKSRIGTMRKSLNSLERLGRELAGKEE